MRPLPLLLSLLSCAALGASAAAAEAQVATPWEVRKEAEELFEDLAKRAPAGADDAALLERVQQLMARSGDRLVELPGAPRAALPLAEALTARLKELGLFERFTRTYAPLAERRLPASGSDAELQAVVRSYPETPAALTAWRRLADRAWDSGRIGAFIEAATRAGDARDAAAAAGRGRRVGEARTLLRPAPVAAPSTVAGLEEMWRLPLDLRATPSKASIRQPRTDQRLPVAHVGMSAPSGDLVCGSDGQRAFVVDHLVGRQQGPLAAVGNTAMLRRQCVPAVLRSGFAVAGVQDVQRLVLVGLERDGSVRWRASSPGLGFNPLISAPVAADRIVAVAMVVSDDESADLRVQAFDQEDGHLVWDVLVARLAGHRSWMFSGDQAYALIPSMCVLDGRLMVLSNSGVIARLGTDGDLQRVWTYRQAGADLDPLGGEQSPARMGSIISDGTVAVATPADLPGETLLLRGDNPPASYRGDGAGGEVVAVGGGMAFLAGARLVGIDLQQRAYRWDAPVPGGDADNPGPGGGPTTGPINGAELQAVLGGNALIVAGRDALAVYDPAGGGLRATRPLEKPVGLTVGDQTLVVAADGDPAFCAAWGGATSVVERLTAAAKADPTDLRSVVALAAITAAREQTDEALAWYDEAFRRGAGAEYAQKAARLLRRRLDLAQGLGWDLPLARFAALAERDPALTLELQWWRARRLEAEGALARAAELYAGIRDHAGANAVLLLRDDLAVHLAVLAAGGLARCGQPDALPWAVAAPAPSPALAAPWEVPARRGRTTLVGNGLAVGYADGVLTANRIDSGAEVWWRRPQRPLLGVRSRNEQPENGVAIDVMPGTSAAAAGLQNDDILLRFNGQDMRSFTADLVPAVLALKVRSPFTAEVLRGGAAVALRGTLGGEMVEPVAINGRSVLVWPTTIGPGQQAMAAAMPGARPEGLWVAVHDLATGAELWRHSVPPTTQEDSPARPLLTDGDLVVLADGGDLVALPAHPAGKEVEPAWRLPGQGQLLRDARTMAGGLLWLPDVGHDQGQLLDAASGRLVARLPVDGTDVPLLSGADCIARFDDGTLACWDLGYARQRWKAPGVARALATRGDAVWVINAASKLVSLDRVSGTVRRLYGDWGGVLDGRIFGDRLYLHVAPTASTHALACVSLAGGAVLWQQPLPADIGALEASAEGVGVVLAPPRPERPAAGAAATVEPAVALAYGPDGTLRRVAVLAGDASTAQARFIAGGLLLAEPAGLRGVVAAVPTDPPPVPSFPADDPEALRWQTVGSARYALAPVPDDKGHDLWVEVADEALTIRLGQLGPAVDDGALRLLFPVDPQAVPAAPPQLVPERQSAPAGKLRWKVRLHPGLFARGGLPWQLRATAGEASDSPPAPWWLRSAWRTIVTPAK